MSNVSVLIHGYPTLRLIFFLTSFALGVVVKVITKQTFLLFSKERIVDLFRIVFLPFWQNKIKFNVRISRRQDAYKINILIKIMCYITFYTCANMKHAYTFTYTTGNYSYLAASTLDISYR